MSIKFRFLSILIVVFFFSVNCTPKKIASDITAQIMASGSPAFEMESDVEVAESTGLTMVKMLEAFQYDNPKNKNLNGLLARSYANYTKGFIEMKMFQNEGVDKKKYEKYLKRAKVFYTRGKEYGLKSLASNGGFKRALNKDLDTFKKSLKSFGRGSVDRLFWTAMCWGNLINLSKDSPLAISQFPKVEAMMARVLKLDEFYYYGGPHLFFGYSYGSRPRMFGGDPAKSKMHFEKALNAYQRKFLLGLVFYAKSYAVQNQDPELYDSLLNEVLNAKPGALPKQRLGNELAQVMAQWMLDNKSKYFE
jgi:hypothetical protein